MNDEQIEKIIKKEFGDVLALTDEEIEKSSFIESCVYLETLNKIKQRIEELKQEKK